ncbi:hypothetical protein BDQ17DRAFT_1430178 [Cyathus striatus]|nr:hypothetical protein BDQ17DRAFT_1430178 [Cyathus striatus]
MCLHFWKIFGQSPPPPCCEISQSSIIPGANVSNINNVATSGVFTAFPDVTMEAEAEDYHEPMIDSDIASQFTFQSNIITREGHSATADLQQLQNNLNKSKKEYNVAAGVAREAAIHATQEVNAAESAKKHTDFTLISAHQAFAVDKAMAAQHAIQENISAVKEQNRAEIVFKVAQEELELHSSAEKYNMTQYGEVDDGAVVDNIVEIDMDNKSDTESSNEEKEKESRNDTGFNSQCYAPPDCSNALAALECLNAIIKPRRKTGYGYHDSGLDSLTKSQLLHMQTFLYMYTSDKGDLITWRNASVSAANSIGCGDHYVKNLH